MVLVLGSELVPKGSLPAIKKIQASSAVVALAVDCCCAIVGCCACEGNIVESVVAEHASAPPSLKFFDLILDVGEEGVGAPSADQHDCVGWFAGEDHAHSRCCSI